MTGRSKAIRRVVVAPDSFKGTFNAVAVAEAIARGFESAGVSVDRAPLADGGEGTALVLERGLGGKSLEASTHDPLGRPIVAHFTQLDNDDAVVEVAQASGLPLLSESELDPLRASSRGTGELILAAVAAGSRRILVACGGSATVDGGEGILAEFHSDKGLRGVEFVCLSDVRTPWELAAATFGPQKGALPQDIPALEARLNRIAEGLPRDPRGVPMTGAAGGISGALWAAYGARLVSGGQFLVEMLDVERRIASAVAVVVGEGRMDETTLEGKLVTELTAIANQHSVPVYAVVGSNALSPETTRQIGIESVLVASTLAELEAAGVAIATSLS